ncbi:hypothetical protein [Phytoactinopolyspora halotolerans]|uniref:Uncharacterized protein n=1 Tax=Phytoactinopolyspora halotolerans TaxID=1981512 RepID=A0A6L9S4F9_9ACTN|nr:hypothetical protein [Phytoactinopolyspora halotolerans]NED99523.1 hypothetical protein [Phytoactinopolyspora halotolerans]
MTDNFDNELQQRLNSLSADTTGTHMPGPHAARRRAAQRTRNQITTGALAGIAVLAIGVIGITQDQMFTAPEPAEPTDTRTPTVSPTTPDTPDETDDATPPDGDPTPPDGGGGGDDIPDDAFMTVEDITPDGEEGDVFPEWTATDARQTPFDCAPVAPDGTDYSAYENDGDGHFLQFIEETEDPVARFSQIRADLERCVRDLEQSDEDQYTQISQTWNVSGIGDEAWMANYFDQMEQPDDFFVANLVSVRMMRTGNYVNVVIQGGPGQDDNANMDTEDSALSGERLCAAFGTECVGEVAAEQTDREPIGDIDGWLRVDDVVAATGLEEIVEGTEPLEANDGGGPPGWALTYLPLDPESAGATFFQRRFYQQSDPTGAVYLSVDQEIAEFPDAETARAHYEDMVAAAESYNDDGRNLENTSSVDEGNRAISTWREEDQEFGITFVFGIALQGTAITVVNHGIDSASDHDVTADQMMDLLTRAADRLSEEG